MFRKRFTNASIKWRGNTTVMSVRLPNPVAEVVDGCVGKPGLNNRGEVLQDFISFAAMLEEQADA